MASLSRSSVLLTVHGTVIPEDVEAARKLHNRTAGSNEGVAAARSLGDLSHNVFVPLEPPASAWNRELLFIDVWKDAQGMGTFFSDKQVQAGAALLFFEREAATWVPAENAFGFELSAPMHMSGRYVGIVQGAVDAPEVAVATFRDVLEPSLSDARRLGQLSHQLYV